MNILLLLNDYVCCSNLRIQLTLYLILDTQIFILTKKDTAHLYTENDENKGRGTDEPSIHTSIIGKAHVLIKSRNFQKMLTLKK